MIKINFYLFLIASILISIDIKSMDHVSKKRKYSLSQEVETAIKNNDCEKIKQLVKDGLDLNKYIIKRNHPLDLAIIAGASEMFQCMLDLGADPYIGDMFSKAKEVKNKWSICAETAEEFQSIDNGRSEIVKILQMYLKKKQDLTKKILELESVPRDIIGLICEYTE